MDVIAVVRGGESRLHLFGLSERVPLIGLSPLILKPLPRRRPCGSYCWDVDRNDGAAAEGLGLGLDGDWVGAQVKARTRRGFQITERRRHAMVAVALLRHTSSRRPLKIGAAGSP
jgi:hypothetical protein